MKFIKPTIASLLAMALLGSAISAQAQTNTPKSEAKSEAKKAKHETIPFKGTIGTVDAAGMSFTLESKDGTKRTFHTTATTKIQKDGKTATLAEITAAEKVTGSYKKDAEGKMTAVSLYAGERPKTDKEAPKVAAPAASATPATPAAPANTMPAPAPAK